MGQAVAKGISVAEGARGELASFADRWGLALFAGTAATEVALLLSAAASGKIPLVVLSLFRALLAI